MEAVSEALQHSDFARVAVILDDLELQARKQGPQGSRPGLMRAAMPTARGTCPSPQAPNPLSGEWPHVLHLLGLIYNKEL